MTSEPPLPDAERRGGGRRLPDRLDPVRIPDGAMGPGDRHPHGRLGEHRRDQRRPGPGVPLLPVRLRPRRAQGAAADALVPGRGPGPGRARTPRAPRAGRAGDHPGAQLPRLSEASRGQRGRDQPGGAPGARPVRERGHGRGVRDLPDRHPLCLALLAPGRARLRGRPFRPDRPPLGSRPAGHEPRDARPAGVAGGEASQEPGEDRGRDRAEGRHGPQEAGAAERPGRDGPPRRDRRRAPGCSAW